MYDEKIKKTHNIIIIIIIIKRSLVILVITVPETETS